MLRTVLPYLDAKVHILVVALPVGLHDYMLRVPSSPQHLGIPEEFTNVLFEPFLLRRVETFGILGVERTLSCKAGRLPSRAYCQQKDAPGRCKGL
jgi:hypothetical protein